MSKKYIISSVILLALVFSFGAKVSAENDGDTPNVKSDSAKSVSITTDVTATMSKECLKVDANQDRKIDAKDFPVFEKFVTANNVARADMDGNKIVNANDLQAFMNAYASCTYAVNTGGVVTGGIKPMPAPVPTTSDDAVIKVQMEKCRNLTNDTAIANCLKMIPAKRTAPTSDDSSDRKNTQSDDRNSDDRNKSGDDDQVGSETPEQLKKMAARYEQRFAEFNALYTRLSKLTDLIDGRIKELEAKKVDVTKAKARLVLAKEHLGYARFSIDSTIKLYKTYGAGNTGVRGSAEMAKNELGIVRNHLIGATRYLSVHDIISDACKKFDVNGDNKLGTDDYVAFDVKFKKGDKGADADMNGTLNANDYQAFTIGYAACNPPKTPVTDASVKIKSTTVKAVNTATEPAPVDARATINVGADVQ